MKKIKFLIRNFFGFSKKETNGFMLLVILLIVLLVFPFLFEKFYSVKEFSTRDKEMLDSLVAIYDSGLSGKQLKGSEKEKHETFYFNPNNASEAELKKIFGSRISGTIVKFRAKGGRFKIKSDLLKVYGVDDFVFHKIENFILLPDVVSYEKKESPTSLDMHKELVVKPFNINEADSLTLDQMKGIGSVLSARIIKYRNRLGGFINEDQYKEVYGLDTLVIAELKKSSYIKSDFVPVKISINNSSWGELATHPYIGKKNSNAIINYRNQHHRFNALDDLKLIRSILPDELLKMFPYLSL